MSLDYSSVCIIGSRVVWVSIKEIYKTKSSWAYKERYILTRHVAVMVYELSKIEL